MNKKRRLSISSASSVSSVNSVLSVLSLLSSASSSSSSQSSESDEEPDRHLKRPRIYRDRTNPFDLFDDDHFKKHFHLSKQTVHYVLELIEDKLKRITERNHPLSPINQLLITLRFYVCGSLFVIVNEDYGATKPTICRTVHRVTQYLALEAKKSMKMPLDDDDENKRNCSNFYEIANFPNVCGIIGCIHIRIQSPGSDIAEYYRNENGWFSIKVQIICDSNLQINAVTSGWPGSTDNNEILNNSTIKTRFDNTEFGDYYLLGDQRYNCNKYLLTPINQPASLAEERYNTAHRLTSAVFEKTTTILKQRFPCLTEGLRIFLKRVPSVVVATCFLHNLAIKFNDHLDLTGEKSNDNGSFNNLDGNDDDKVRKFVINSIFTN